MHERIAAEVLAFLEHYVDSVPHLEGLLLLWQSSPAEWEADELAARIYVPQGQARAILDDLVRHDLLVPAEPGSGRYTYNVQNRHANAIPNVADAYRTQLVPVSTFIHSKGSKAVREFARAFKLKDDPQK